MHKNSLKNCAFKLVAQLVNSVFLATLFFVLSSVVNATTSSGKLIYDRYCAFCHGLTDNADTDVTKMLIPHPRHFCS